MHFSKLVLLLVCLTTPYRKFKPVHAIGQLGNIRKSTSGEAGYVEGALSGTSLCSLMQIGSVLLESVG